jgi:hypothetical protein
LLLSINTLRLDRSLAAAVSAFELWDDDNKKLLATTSVTKDPESQGVFSKTDLSQLRLHRVRDCMAVYRLSALKKLTLADHDRSRFLGKQALPALLEQGRRITVLASALCSYSEKAIADEPVAEPTKLGRDTLRNIEQLLQQKQEQEGGNKLFHANVPAPKAPKRNIHTMLYKLSTLKKIGAYAAGAVLLAIAAALFMLLRTPVFFIIGLGFLALAVCAAGLTAAMLVCNLYYKKNPQRLVNN